MSRDGSFWRRDQRDDRHRVERRETDRDGLQRDKDSGRKWDRDRQRDHSRSRPVSSRRTTDDTEYYNQPVVTKIRLASELSSDPRRRMSMNSDRPISTRSGTSSPIVGSPMILDAVTRGNIIEVKDRSNETSAGGTQRENSALSQTEAIANTLIKFAADAYTTASLQKAQEVAQERFMSAIKTDEANRKSLKGWTVLIEQGEEDKAHAETLLAKIKARAQDSLDAHHQHATAVSKQIIDLISKNESTRHQQQDPTRIDQLEETVKNLANELQQIKNATQATAASSREISNRMDQSTRDYGSIAENVADCTKQVAAVIGQIPMYAKKSEVAKSADVTNMGKTLDELAEKYTRLFQMQEAFKKDHGVDRTSISRLHAEFLTYKLNASASQGHSDMNGLRTSIKELDDKLANMVQRPDFVRLSSAVEAMSTQQAEAQLSSNLSRQAEILEHELQRIDQQLQTLDTTRVNDYKTLALDINKTQADVIHLRGHVEKCQVDIQEVVEDSGPKETLISEKFKAHDSFLNQLEADLQKTKEDVKPTPFAATSAISNEVPQFPMEFQLCLRTMEELQKETTILRSDLIKLFSSSTKLQADLQRISESNIGQTHSIRALTQRYHNISSEDMVRAMLGQLQNIFPQASNIEGSFERLGSQLSALRDTHNALARHMDTKFATCDAKFVTIEDGQVSTEAKLAENETKFQNLVNNIRCQRDSLKEDLGKSIQAVEEKHTKQHARLEEKLKEVQDMEATRRNTSNPPRISGSNGFENGLIPSNCSSPFQPGERSSPGAHDSSHTGDYLNSVWGIQTGNSSSGTSGNSDAQSDGSETLSVQKKPRSAASAPSTSVDIHKQKKRKLKEDNQDGPVFATLPIWNASDLLRAKMAKKP